jgi:hypothetical protein
MNNFLAVPLNNATNSNTLLIVIVVVAVAIAALALLGVRHRMKLRNAPDDRREALMAAEFQLRPRGRLVQQVGINAWTSKLSEERIKEIAAENGYEFVGKEPTRHGDSLRFELKR